MFCATIIERNEDGEKIRTDTTEMKERRESVDGERGGVKKKSGKKKTEETKEKDRQANRQIDYEQRKENSNA